VHAIEIGLPVSIDSALANFSKSRSVKSAIRKRILEHSAAGVFDQSRNAFLLRRQDQHHARPVRDLRTRLAGRGFDII
jgi:hypothetical protein